MMVLAMMAAAMSPVQAQAMPARGPRADRMERMFAMADTDRNGQLSRAELSAARARMQERRAHRREMRQQRAGGQPRR